MKFLKRIVPLCILLFVVSCGTVHVSSDYDRDANFTTYKTFAFHEKGLENLNMNDLDKRRIVSAISNELQQKGLQPLTYENSADIVINISAKSKTRVNVDPWYNPWWGMGPFWGMNQNRIRQYKEGTLILDFVDKKQNTLVWQGVGEGLNISNLEGKAEKIPLAVQEILEKYPPKR